MFKTNYEVRNVRDLTETILHSIDSIGKVSLLITQMSSKELFPVVHQIAVVCSNYSGMSFEIYNAIPTIVQMQVIVSFSNFAVTEPSVTASQRAAHS